MTAPPVSLLVPTHDHAGSLGAAVGSALAQDAGDLHVIVIADGVGPDTRDVLADLRRTDRRVRVVDRPKSPRHAEVVRHEVLSDPNMSPIVGYLGDDDLLLPHHVGTLTAALADADFAHPLPILVQPDDSLVHLPLDLGRAQCVAWELGDPPRNAISLTGVMHTLESYRRLPHGWRQTPAGRWTDHYMWQQYLALPGIRAVTAARATTVKLLGDPDRPGSAGERSDRWSRRVRESGFATWWESEVEAAVRRAAVTAAMDRDVWMDHSTALAAQVTQLTAQAERAGATDAQLSELRAAHERLGAELDRVARSRSWRMTAPLRRAAAAVRTRRGG